MQISAADQERILREFGVDPVHMRAEDRLKAIETISQMLFAGVVSKSVGLLTDEKATELEVLCDRATALPPNQGAALVNSFLASTVDLNAVTAQVREEVRDRIRAGLHPVNAAKADAGRSDDALASAIEPLTDAAGNPAAEVGGLAVDLLFDPARGVRTKTEKQKWLAQKLATNLMKAAFTFWSSLVAFTTCAGVERNTGWNVSNDSLSKALPEWFTRQPLGGQLKMLLLLAPILAVLLAIVVGLSVLFARTRLVSRILEPPIKDDDRASTLLRIEFARRSCAVSTDDLTRLAPLVYSGVLLAAARSKNRYEKQRRILDAVIASDGEDAAVRFVRSQVWRYGHHLRTATSEVARRALPIMTMNFDRPA